MRGRCVQDRGLGGRWIRGRRVQRRVLGQHGGLQPPQLRPRIDAKLAGQQSPGALISPERITLAPRPVQGHHQLAPQPLAQRMLLDQRLELPDQLAMPAQHQLGLDPVLERGQPRFSQPGDHRGRELAVGKLGQRCAPPQAQGLTQQPSRRRRVLEAQRGAALRRQILEPVGVHGARRHLEGVTPGPADDAIAAEYLAQPGDIYLQPVPGGEIRTGPQPVQQLISGHRMPARQRERGQQRPRPGPADIHHPAVVIDNLERPEDAQLHGSPS